MIENILNLIKDQIGLDLKQCQYFTGLFEYNKSMYFNIVLDQRISESKDFDLLNRFSKKSKLFRIEPNGFKRVAIFLN